MTFEERTIIRMAINHAKRAWLEEEGGYKHVEADAKGQELVLARRAQGEMTRGELHARIAELEGQLKTARGRITNARRSRDEWKRKANTCAHTPAEAGGALQRAHELETKVAKLEAQVTRLLKRNSKLNTDVSHLKLYRDQWRTRATGKPTKGQKRVVNSRSTGHLR